MKNDVVQAGAGVVAFSTLFEQAPQLAFVVDPALMLLAANGVARRFLGKTATQINGLPLLEALPAMAETTGQLRNRLEDAFARVRAQGAAVSLSLAGPALIAACREAQSTPQTGLRQPNLPGLVHCCLSPILDEAGTLVAISTIALVIDDVKSATASLTIEPTAPARPLAPDIISAMGSAGEVPVGGMTAGTQDASLRILLVEDNPDMLYTTEEQLKLLGHRVTGAADAEQAMRHLAAGSFDLLFTDLSLPKMTGAELARLVLQQYRPMRVVIASGYGRAMANAQNLAAVFLPKPYGIADLQQALRNSVIAPGPQD